MATDFMDKAAHGSFENVWRAVESVTPDELAAAAEWWFDARTDVERLAESAGLDFERMAYVVAVGSPGVPWPAALQNIRVLIAARNAGADLPAGPGCGLEIPVGRRHIEKAWAILRGADVAVCRGPKVEALAANLLGDMRRVTVDRHITMIATAGASRQVSKAECVRIGLMLAQAADSRGVAPALVMCALWLRSAKTRALAGATRSLDGLPASAADSAP